MKRREFVHRSAGTLAALTVSSLIYPLRSSAEESGGKEWQFEYRGSETIDGQEYSYSFYIYVPQAAFDSDIESVRLVTRRTPKGVYNYERMEYTAEVKSRKKVVDGEWRELWLKCRCFESEDEGDLLKGTSLTKLRKRRFYLHLLTKNGFRLIAKDKKKRELQTFTLNDPGNNITPPGAQCYLTTACTSHLGKPDDCYELQTLRKFRDEYIAQQPEGNEWIRMYYESAPILVRKINSLPNREEVLDYIYSDMIQPTLGMIEAGDDQAAFAFYRDYTLALAQGMEHSNQ